MWWQWWSGLSAVALLVCVVSGAGLLVLDRDKLSPRITQTLGALLAAGLAVVAAHVLLVVVLVHHFSEAL